MAMVEASSIIKIEICYWLVREMGAAKSLEYKNLCCNQNKLLKLQEIKHWVWNASNLSVKINNLLSIYPTKIN